MRKTNLLLALLVLLTATTTMTAQDRLFTMEELVFGRYANTSKQPAAPVLRWWGDRLMYLDKEEVGIMEKGLRHNAGFTLETLNKALTGSTDKDKREVKGVRDIYFPYADQPVAYVKTTKHVVLYNWQTGEVKKQALDGAEVSEWTAKTGALALKKPDHQLYVRDAAGRETQLTTDGSTDIVYGEAVHRNEFGIDGGLFWSPDGRRLAFYRMDQSMVADYPQVDIFQRIAKCEPDKYPMAGCTSHKVTVGIHDMETGKTVYLQAGDPTDRYFTNIAWSPDATTVYMLELNRAQNDCRLVAYDATTGTRKGELCREQHEKYVEPEHPILFLPWDDTKFILQSQRDGYNHLYLYDTSGKLLKQLTSGPFVVATVEGFNKKQKTVIITSTEAHPLQRNLYAVSIATGKRTLLDDGTGVHRAALSATGTQVIDHRYTPETWVRQSCIQTATGKAEVLFTSDDPWEGYAHPLFEQGSIKAADGTTDLYYRMVKPHDFDATKKYPTVVYVYGGPHVRNVEASWHWGSRIWETYMSQLGYIVFVLDSRGSSMRGREFEQATFHQLGQVEMQDQMKGVEFLRTLPYVDGDRLGVHGWSFGGFMTTSLMTTYPDVFKVGVAGGPVIDWKWYEVMYGERYMGTPESNPEGYEKTSLVAKAKNLKGKLQIITGYNDRTVVPQHCLSFIDACIKAGVQPDFFVYPGEEHNMRGQKSVHLNKRIAQYFEDYLK